jgi:hypothetical protein
MDAGRQPQRGKARRDQPRRKRVIGLFLIAVGGGINTYRIHRLLSRSSEPAPHLFQGLALAFVTGAIFYGLPLWGIFVVLKHFA